MKKKDKSNNPKGKGGFKDNPDHINRNGRPKKGETFKDILNDVLEQDFIELKKKEDGTIEKINRGKTKRLIVQSWVRHALAGSASHLKEMVERLDGKVPDVKKYVGDEDHPIKIVMKPHDSIIEDLFSDEEEDS